MSRYIAFLRAIKLRELLGSEPIVLFRKFREIEALVRAAPFKEIKAGADVAFLSQKPRARPRLPLLSTQEALEAFEMTDREVFIVSRRRKNGMYGFPNNFIEKELGVAATTRNWSTVKKIVALVS